MNWHLYANCIGEDPKLFYPESHARGMFDAGKVVCAGCDVRAECLAAAMAAERGISDLRHGLYGGLTPTERDAYQKEHGPGRDLMRVNAVFHGTDSCYARGCRRAECRAAHTEASRRRREVRAG